MPLAVNHFANTIDVNDLGPISKSTLPVELFTLIFTVSTKSLQKTESYITRY